MKVVQESSIRDVVDALGQILHADAERVCYLIKGQRRPLVPHEHVAKGALNAISGAGGPPLIESNPIHVTQNLSSEADERHGDGRHINS